MANLDRIVKCDISLNTTGITTAGFNTMMIVGPHAYGNERVISVSDSDELLEMGFKSTDAIYIAVNDALSQSPRPAEVKVGRMQCDTVKLALIAEAPVQAAVYAVTIESVDEAGNLISNAFSYTAQEQDNNEAVLTALSNAIMAEEAINTVYAASVASNELIIKATDPQHSFVVLPNGKMKVSAFEAADIDVAENMAMITAADDDWYGLIYVSRKQADIIAMADWTESHTKLYGTSIAEAGVANAEVSTDTGSKLKEGNYYRTYWFYHPDADTDYLEAAIMARCFAITPGGETWANKQLSAVKTDKLTNQAYNAITAKNGNTFEPFRNVTITQNGKVAAGEWIDVIRFRDWTVENIQTEAFSVLINRDKLPFTDDGITAVENVVNSVLAKGQKNGGIAPTEYDDNNEANLGYKITVPLASSISANTKAQRKLTGIKFVARLAGAIHVAEIKGSFTYENIKD